MRARFNFLTSHFVIASGPCVYVSLFIPIQVTIGELRKREVDRFISYRSSDIEKVYCRTIFEGNT